LSLGVESGSGDPRFLGQDLKISVCSLEKTGDQAGGFWRLGQEAGAGGWVEDKPAIGPGIFEIPGFFWNNADQWTTLPQKPGIWASIPIEL